MPLIKRIPSIFRQTRPINTLTQRRLLLQFRREALHESQAQHFFVLEKPQPRMWPLINPIRFRSHERRPDDHSLDKEHNCETEMVAEEYVTPRCGYGRGREEPEVVGVLIENSGAVY